MTRAYNTATTQQNTGGAVAGVTAGKNKVINGGMDIWQRGTSVAISGAAVGYVTDRWQVQSAAASVSTTTTRQVTSDTTNLPSIQYCARVQRNSGVTANGFISFQQSLETIETIPFVGKTVTLSFYARAGANYSAASSSLGFQLRTGTGTDQNVTSFTGTANPIDTSATLTTTWQRFTASVTLGTSVTQLGLNFYALTTGTAGAADYFEITGVQVEVGSVATPFSRAAGTIQGELAACQRYFRIVSSAVGIGINSTTQIQSSISHPGMRTTPSVALTAVATFTDCAVADYTQSSATITIQTNDADGGRYQASYFTGITSLRAYILLSSGGKVQLSAEL